MSLLGKITSVVTDPGELVKDVVNSVLPKELAVVGDVAGAVVDVAKGSPLAINHALEAIRDLPQAASAISQGLAHVLGDSTRTISGHSEGWRGSPAFEPTPPARGPQVSVSVNGNQVTVTVNGPHEGSAHAGWHGAPPATHGWHGAPSATHGWHGTPMEVGWHGTPHVGNWHGAVAPGTPSPASISVSVAPTTTNGGGSIGGDGAIGSKDQINSLSDAAFMNAVRDGKISPEVAKDPAAMLQIQERMNRITQMNQLMSQMLAAMHQMATSTIQNIRA